MPKTFPISLEVEEIALGTVLRKLHDMPGIAKLHLNLGHGGQGAGKKQLTHAAAEARGLNGEQAVIRLLMHGPKHVSEISAALGGKKTRAYGVMTSLRKQGLTESAQGHGMHQLSAAGRARLKVNGNGAAKPLALPPPTPSGRAAPGHGASVLVALLVNGPLSPSSLRQQLASQGMSAKSAGGVLERAKRDGLIKKNAANAYMLTAKGLKRESAHG